MRLAQVFLCDESHVWGKESSMKSTDDVRRGRVYDHNSCLEWMNSINGEGCDHMRRMCTRFEKRVMHNMHTCGILYNKRSFTVRLTFGIANSDSVKRACVRSVRSLYCKNKLIKCVGSAYRFYHRLHSFIPYFCTNMMCVTCMQTCLQNGV